MAEFAPTEVAHGVHRFGSRLVNCYMVDDGGRLTVVDCGLPGFWDQVEPGLSSLGRSLQDVAAIVLTHGDNDHVGFAERLREASGAPVSIHQEDVPLATTKEEKETEASLVPYLRESARRRAMSSGDGLAWAVAGTYFEACNCLPICPCRQIGSRAGGRSTFGVCDFALSWLVTRGHTGTLDLSGRQVVLVGTYEDGQTLEVPGAPRVLFTPGHTSGHCAIHFERHGVVFAGDALCTRNPLTGKVGSQLLPSAFNVSSERAMASLGAIEATAAQTVLPGHGEPWTDGAAAAVEEARSRGPT